ncbi:MAG: hypothetical protein P0Y53_15915 [Candidatus Pseudobacter hemicellulosilyticus]|uniref:Uncharacterized protein n=1 Tax=Candidatus Pseudobacter hemicellulosilyticus TaxID=3121375 RepID=A0AAJ5WQ30_9BACT|nr:MAG: hypothetical protein P0Y53_15915 [Pseudobacter sp.]
MLRKIILWACILISQSSSAQSVSGAWYGRADVVAQGTHNNYLTELVLRQKGNTVEGIFSYYFKDSYQSFYVRGKYNKDTREVTIRNLPMLLYASTNRNGIECPMNFMGILMVNKVSSSITGSFFSDPKYKYTCPELRVTFSMDAAQGNGSEILRDAVVGKKIWHPQEEDIVVTVSKEGIKKDSAGAVQPEPMIDTAVAIVGQPAPDSVLVKAEAPKKDSLIAKTEPAFKKPPTEPETVSNPTPAPPKTEPVKDTVRIVPITEPATNKPKEVIAKATTEKPEKEVAEVISRKPASSSRPSTTSPTAATERTSTPAEKAPAKIARSEKDLLDAFNKRSKVYAKDLEFTGDSIRISFYDNGDVDGDTISVLLDNVPILVSQGITDRGTHIYIALDSLKSVSEISMFAENLGKYPPNTALMVVTDGVNRYEVFLSSSLEKSATVRIKRKKGGDGGLKKIKNSN